MQTIESLNMTVGVLKSLISDYHLRCTQAEAIAGKLLGEKLSDEQLQKFFLLIKQQLDIRANERAIHQQALIQATLMSLEAALKIEDSNKLRMMITNIVKQLISSQAHMNYQQA